MSDRSLCGTCLHFGSDLPEETLVQVRVNPEAERPELGTCGMPSNARLHLRVSATSSCDAYSPAA